MDDAPERADHVLDASALIKLIVAEPESDAFRAWYAGEIDARSTFAAPGLLAYEMANLLTRNFARPSGAKPQEWLRDSHQRALAGIALDHGAVVRAFAWVPTLTAYDASYLATAAATGATLVSYDDALLKEARKSGIRTITPR